MALGTGAEISVLTQISTLVFIYLGIKFIVWNKIFELLGTMFKNKYTFSLLLFGLIAAIIDPTLWDTYFVWIAFLVDSLKTAVEFIVIQLLSLLGFDYNGF